MYYYIYMKLIILDGKDPYRNLAIEEYLFLNSDDDVFMLWQNDRTVVIGKNQNAYAEVNTEFVLNNGIKIARRITGGGAVYHDLGNVNYTFISVDGSRKSMDFKSFTEPIIEALSSLGVVCELSGRNDLTVNGRKISGNAQYSQGGRVLHHGTLLFKSDVDVIVSALNVDEEKIATKAIKSVRSRVANISDYTSNATNTDEFIALIAQHVCKTLGATIAQAPSAKEIDALEDRNKSSEWIYPEKDFLSKYTAKSKKRFCYGTVELHLNMRNGKIINAKISGDFFGCRDISELETWLSNKYVSELSKQLDDVCLNEYIYGMNKTDFLSLL